MYGLSQYSAPFLSNRSLAALSELSTHVLSRVAMSPAAQAFTTGCYISAYLQRVPRHMYQPIESTPSMRLPWAIGVHLHEGPEAAEPIVSGRDALSKDRC